MKIEDGLPVNPLDEPVGNRVSRGIALLNEQCPDWRTRVNPDILDMRSPHRCVLGQLFGTYGAGMASLRITTIVEGTRYGFDVASTIWDRDYEQTPELTDAWRAVLTSTPTV